MDDSELEELEEQEQPLETESSSFPRRTMMSSNRGNIPSALSNRSLAKRSNNDERKNNNGMSNKSRNNRGLNGELPQKDAKLGKKLKRKKKPFNFNNRINNKVVGEDKNNDSTNQVDNHHNEEDASPIDVAIKAKRTILLIKIGLILAGIFIVFLIIFVVVYFFASVLGISDSFSTLGSNGGLDPSAPYYDEAVIYYEKLNDATEMYADSCGIYLDRSYIHAVLTYRSSLSNAQETDREKEYLEMADNVFNVAKLMVTNCVADYEIGGSFYNNLKNSAFFKRYYKEQLEYIDADSLTTSIFEYAELGIELASLGSGFINDKLKVKMGTCEQPYNNKLLNDGTSYSSIVGFSDYVMGVVMGEVEGAIKRENFEFLKAFTIVASSYALGRSKYQSGDEEIWVHNGNCWQLSCDIYEGCTYCYDLPGGFGTTFTGQERTCNDVGYHKNAMSPEQRQIMDEVFQEVFGTVMLKLDGNIMSPSYRDKSTTCGNRDNCLGQEDAAHDAQNGMNYKEILEKYYDNFTLSNMSEDSYTGNVSYTDGGYSGKVVYYDQTDYTDRFCGLDRTIKTDGCGVTSMAMILSTFVNASYTPPVVMKEAYNGKYCGGSIVGTNASFFKYSAENHGLGYQAVSKTGDKQLVLDALKTGNSLVIAHMGPGTFTNSGHYIVLTKVNEKGQVYVLDSNNSRRTGWHDFNSVVVKQLKGSFHIITKR